MEFLRLLESVRTPFFDQLFQFFTLFGEETVFMAFAMLFYWCIDKKGGYFLLYTCFLGQIANQFLKLIFCVPRPWVLDEDFTIVESARAAATGYSFPSGHTQCAAGLFLGIARVRRERWIRVCSVALTLLVGFSRMYLGVHTPADVLVSLGVAALLVFAAYPLFSRAWTDRRYRILLLGALLIAGVALLIYVEFVPLPAGAILEYSLDGAKTAYVMLGASTGFCAVLWLEQRYIRFDVRAVWWAQILKALLGLAVVVVVRMLLSAPLLALAGGHNVAHFIRYFLMVVVGGALWPLTFRFWSKLGRRAEVPSASAS